MCTGCGLCITECPADAIALRGRIAQIDMDECIRCGACHKICPRDAVRHDSDQVPLSVEENLKAAERLLGKCGSDEAKQRYLDKYLLSAVR